MEEAERKNSWSRGTSRCFFCFWVGFFLLFFYIFFVSHREDFLAKDSHEEMIISWQFSSGPLLQL